MILDAICLVLAEYEPMASHGDMFCFIMFVYCLTGGGGRTGTRQQTRDFDRFGELGGDHQNPDSVNTVWGKTKNTKPMQHIFKMLELCARMRDIHATHMSNI